MPKLGVNIDHIATLRRLRNSSIPDIIFAAKTCEKAGADSLVAHLREDRRHIQDADVEALRRIVKTRFNLEMSLAPEIVRIAGRIRPDQATFVPEKREELTTEGGLDVIKFSSRIRHAAARLKKRGIAVSLFIEPERRSLKRARDIGVDIVELHTGRYANSRNRASLRRNLLEIREAVLYARDLGLTVNAGHGLDYNNVCAIASIPGLYELNIGYSIVCYSVFLGLEAAVEKMKQLIGDD